MGTMTLAQLPAAVADHAVAVVLGVVLLLVVVVVMIVALVSRATRAANQGISGQIGGLQKLTANAQLTPEESAKVAAALSRKMSKMAEERMRASKGAPLEQLALEAQVIAAQAQAAKAQAPATDPAAAINPAPTATMPATAPEQAAPPAQPPPPAKPSAPKLPPRLEHVAHRSATELDDLVNAGFLTREDVELVLAAQRGGTS